MTVYIAYGWPEGNKHSKQFRKILKDSGYQISNHSKEADIIVAHSAGCYMLPADLKAKVILLIGLPNWPNKPLIRCTNEKVRQEIKDSYWFKKTFWHLIYAVSQPIRPLIVYKNYKRKYLPEFKNSQVILIHNRFDTFMQKEASNQLAQKRNWPLKQLDGQHDDLWQNTQSYLAIIKDILS